MHVLAAGNNMRSLLMDHDAQEYSTAEELLTLAADRKGWAARVRQINPTDHNTATAMVTTSLDASAEELEKVAQTHDALFTG